MYTGAFRMLLELRGIEKRFGGVVALRDGTLSVAPGEVHLLMGENGAGKSTLMKIVAGLQGADGGEMLWRGERVTFAHPKEAAALGIAMVHQESLLAPHLTVAENIFLGREPGTALGWVDRGRIMREAARLIEQHRFPLRAEWRVDRMSPAAKQLVEICRALQHGSSLVIFDEPTSSLSDAEAEEVFRIARTLRERNMGIIYITHRLEELRSLGDRVTVLRDGVTVHSGPLAELTRERLIQYMVGREISAARRRESLAPGAELLRVRNLSRRPALKNISFELRAGEIVGMAGLVGAGRTELCRALFGVDPVDSGEVLVKGVARRIGSPAEAVAAGLALIPEDRQRTGLSTALAVSHNITVANLKAVSRMEVLDLGRERRAAASFIDRLRIRAESPRQRAGRLSGGNQQKVVIAKWLFRGARVLLFDEPTRGIDVGAKAEVFEVMDQLARDGAAILMVSSELGELLQVADRILVMRAGEITGELEGAAATQEQIMHYATLPLSAKPQHPAGEIDG
jgi:ribose transport system ATP-binding protein